MKRIRAIAHKEFLHILRDPRSLALALLMPMMMVFLYGYAIDMDMKELKAGIMDLDESSTSRELVRRMTSSGFIVDAERLNTREEIERGFRRGRFHAAVVIPRGFEESLMRDKFTPVQMLIDGADGTSAAVVNNYLNAVIAMMNRDRAQAQGTSLEPPIETRPRIYYNPELVSAHFIVPGLAAVVLIMICALLTSIAITREKETGTLEQMLTTPVRAGQVIVGKIIPYMTIGALDTALVFVVGTVVFGVPMAGSWFVLAGYSLVYLLVSLGIGLLISAAMPTQQLAMMIALVGTLLPTMMLSGFVFPIPSMPVVLQGVSHIIPATYYLEIVRGVMLRGEAWFPQQLAVLTGMAVFLLVAASRRFRLRLE
ncbi:ABC transporter permease [bacterium]|nr:ABC transporter permease [bacterium]MBU1983290.1 ABC transporter permease [bacterium]